MALTGEGEPLWTWEAGVGDEGEAIHIRGLMSISPLVIKVDNTPREQIWHVDPQTGEHTVVLDNPYACENAANLGFVTCGDAVVVDGKLIYTTHREQADDSGGETFFFNRLVAVDLATGKEAWCQDVVESRLLTPVAVDDGRVIAYQSSFVYHGQGIPAMLLSVDPATGEDTPVAAFGPESYEEPQRELTEVSLLNEGNLHGAVWDEGRFALYTRAAYVDRVDSLETLAIDAG